jgi:hypothetical protein
VNGLCLPLKEVKAWVYASSVKNDVLVIFYVRTTHSLRSSVNLSQTAQYIPTKPGAIVDATSGKMLGTHKGLWTYTVGQNARISGCAEKMFVSGKDVSQNEIHVVNGS